MNDTSDQITPEAVDAFIERWQDTGGKKRANYQLFLTELCRAQRVGARVPVARLT